jgi:hypothetical protein
MNFPKSWRLYIDSDQMKALRAGERVVRETGHRPAAIYDPSIDGWHYAQKGDTMYVEESNTGAESGIVSRAKVVETGNRIFGKGKKRIHRAYFVVLVKD